MRSFRIFCDLAAPEEAQNLLRESTRGHVLLLPKELPASVLQAGKPDPQLATADIAFGQPDAGSLAAAPNLKWVHVSSSGITRYDTPEFRALAASRHFALSNSASVYAEPCAVHVLSFIVAQARNLPEALASQAPNSAPQWHQLRSNSGTLSGQTLLIVGYGAIGRRLAELLEPFHVRVIAYRRKARGDENVPLVSLDELPHALAEADHVVNILPDSAETRRFFDNARLRQLKRGAAFYNIGRGTTVDQEALHASLRSGHLASAWLDVTDPEPLPPDHPLRSLGNCFVTPHIAGGHFQEAHALVRHFVSNLDRFVRGEPLVDRVM